jgi:dTDP-4-dehydrorhamnose 3,5-epimerase-like enzyme/dTDP-4-dehydrorhamnose reductase
MFTDERGTLIFPIKNNELEFKQCTVSINHKNVFRGLHCNSFDKLVTCIKGKILDIIVNFDNTADDYLIPKYYHLDSSSDFFQLIIPKNYGHGFLSLEDDSTIVYHFNGIFSDEDTKHIHYLDPTINISLPISNPVVSKKDNIKNYFQHHNEPDIIKKKNDYVIFGANGFLGKNIIKHLESQNKNYIQCNLRLNEIDKIEKFIKQHKPKYVINCAGITGTPNIFWCDDNKTETIETNIIYQLTLLKLCNDNNIHLTIMGSGGIFNNDKFYTEVDEGNFEENFYSKTRIYLENIVKCYKNVLYLRVNYPICDDKSEKNLITKLLSYKKIDNIELSITYIDNLFPVLFDMIEQNETGVCNFVNNGSINLPTIMEKYNKYSKHDYSISSDFFMNRSYSKLLTGKLNKYNTLNIEEAIEVCIQNYIIKNNECL